MPDESARPTGQLASAAAPVARVALVAALAWAGWALYRSLPADPSGAFGDRGRGRPTTLRVVLRLPEAYAPEPGERVALRLYPVNVEAARREYASQRRPGVRFDEYLQRRMGGRAPVSAEFDENGEAVVSVAQGRWWLHAEVEGPEALTWRLPVNVAGPEKTVELSAENAYTREKSF
jgi:hypothetical protein